VSIIKQFPLFKGGREFDTGTRRGLASIVRGKISPNPSFLNLKAAVERGKAVQTIDVHREFKNCVVTFWVMSQFFNFLGATRGCADFRDPTAVFRLKRGILLTWQEAIGTAHSSLCPSTSLSSTTFATDPI
jgi:hypothetical protein